MTQEEERSNETQEYDATRPDIAERDAELLKEVKALDAPDTQTAVEAVDESEDASVQELPGATIDDEQ